MASSLFRHMILVAPLLFGITAGCTSEKSHTPPTNLCEALEQGGASRKLFHPRPAPRSEPNGARNYDIPVEGASLAARWYLFNPRWPTILFFHGNGEVINDYEDVSGAFRGVRANLFLVEYRGYGWSSGTAGLRHLRKDTEQSFRFFLKERKKEAPRSPTVVMGRSLGSGPATFLALQDSGEIQGLVLESAYSDIRPILRLLQIDTGTFEKEAHTLFSNTPRLRKIRQPVLLLHGERDRSIPLPFARKNFSAIPHERKVLKVIEGAGHNDLITYRREYFGALRTFLQGIPAPPPP